ncbi:MAG TPA: carbon starvation protein A, partial [Planctomycetes bacterium]|nr:carbon starvation protein A [Planctomycetota bacterium]
RFRVPVLPATLGGLVLIALTLVAGHHYPLLLSVKEWKLLLLGYIYVASVTPVWILLQPRDFLNSFLLYALLVAGVAGTLLVDPALHMKAWAGFKTDLGPLFPILFVTVACGALSGFHSLVASGTTAKQLDSEAHARPIAMGAMLIESLLAVVALVTAAMLVPGKYDSQIHEGAVHVFASGIARFVDAAGGSFAFGLTFASVAVAEFALTSLDTATRIARFAFQELLQVPEEAGGSVASLRRLFSRNRFLATTVTVFFGGWLALSGGERTIWPIFGAANQLLAALAFLAVFVWMAHRGKKAGFLAVPTVFMFLVTLGALGWEAVHFVEKKNWILAVLAVFLAVLAVVLAFDAFRVLSRSRAEGASPAPEPE